MTADEKVKTVSFRLDEGRWRRLKVCLLKNDTTIQKSFEAYTDRYIEAFEKEMK
jgi:predicted phosphoadenosine phosphosulfate sulfurtransferase